MNHKSAAINYLLLGLIGFSVFALAIGFWQIKQTIRSPFASQLSANQTAKNQEAQIGKLMAESRQQDTDGDGLADFDEIYFRKTGAYLPDTDNDGFSDSEEIKAGSNPLDLGSTPLNKKPGQANLEQSFKLIRSNEPQNQVAAPGAGLSTQEIRDLLVQKGGLDRATVDKIDDEPLIKLYNETKAETGINPQELSGPAEQKMASEKGAQAIEDLRNLTPTEIRQLLLLNGMDQSALEQIDDQSLKQIFLDTMAQQLKQQ